MPSVDKRIVEMRFDNNDFETDVSESISSLDKLKKSLNFKDAGRGFDELGRSADAVSVKFSALSSITDQFFRNIENRIYEVRNQVVGLIKSMSTDQITAGMTKYEQKTASVQTILNSTGKTLDEVNGYLERLMTYSDETSYGFTDMTQALQTMTSSGGDLDKLIPMIMGIGNAVSFAGKGAAEFTRVMAYGVNQAYSLGYMGTLDWKSIMGAGVNSKQLQQTLLDVVREQKKGEYTLNEFSKALTDKVIDTAVMEEAFGRFAAATLEAEKLVNEGKFDQFSEAYEYLESTNFKDLYDGVALKAAKAAQEAKTFTEAIEATKDAVSSGWMETFEILLGDYEEAKVNWTWLAQELWEVFAQGAEARNEMLSEWAENGGYEKLWESIKNLWYGVRGIGDRIIDAWHRIFPSMDTQKLLDITDRIYTFSVKFKERFAVVSEAITELADTVEEKIPRITNKLGFKLLGAEPGEEEQEFEEYVTNVDDNVRRLANTLTDLDKILADIQSGKYGNNPNRRKQLEEEGYSFELVQNAINELYGSEFRYAIAEEDLAKARKLQNGELVDEIDNLDKIKKAYHDANQENKNTHDWIEDLRDVLGGFKSALDLVVEAAKLAYKYLVTPTWNFLVRTFKRVLSVIAPFSRSFTDFVNRLKETNALETRLQNLIVWLKDLRENLKNQENVQKFIEFFQQIKDKVESIKESSLDKVNGFFDRIVNLDVDLPDVNIIGMWFNDFLKYITPAINKVKEIEGFWPKIKEFFKGLDFSGATQFGKSAAEGISEFLKTLFSDNGLKETGKNWLDSLWEGVKEKINEIDWGEIISLAVKALAGASLVKLAIAVSNLFNGIANIADGSAGIFGALGDVIHGFTRTLKATAILEVAIAIGIIAAAMWALSQVDSDKLAYVTTDIAAIILALSVLMKVLSGVGKFIGDDKKLKNVGNLTINFPRLGVALIGLGVAILSIVAAVKILSKVDTGKMWGIFAFLAAIFALFSGIAVSLNLMEVSGRKMVALAGAFAITALGINLLVIAITALTGLATLNITGMLASVLAISVLMIAFGGMAALSYNSNNVLQVAAGFLIISAAILLLTPALIAMSIAINKENWWTIFVLLGAIIVIMATMVGAITILNVVAKKTGKMDQGIKAMYALAVGIAAIGAVLLALRGTKFKDLIGTVGAIVILMVALAAIVGILGAVAGHDPLIAIGMLAASAAILIFSAAIALAGVGVLAFAKALEILSRSSIDAKKTGKNLAEGVVAFFDELVTNGQSIIKFVEMVLSAIIGILILKKSSIVDTGAGIIDALGKKIIETIEGSKFKIAIAALAVIGALLYVLNVNMPTVATFLGYMIANVINSVATAIRDTGGLIWAAMLNLGAAIVDLFGYGLKQAIQTRMEEKDSFGMLLKFFFGKQHIQLPEGHWLRNTFDSLAESMTEEEREAFEQYRKQSDPLNFFIDSAHERTSKIEETQNEINSALMNLNDKWKIGLTNFSKEGTKAVESYEDPYMTLINKILSASKTLKVNDVVIINEELRRLQEDLLHGFISEKDLEQMFPKYFEDGYNTSVNASIGLDGMSSLMDMITGKVDIDSIYNAGSEAGANLILGEVEGWTSEEQNAIDALNTLMGGQENALVDYWQYGSPSKVMIQYGIYWMQGLINGINSKTNSLLNSIRHNMDQVTAILKEKTAQLNKTIYGVLDPTNSSNFTEASLTNSLNSVISRIMDAINGDIDMTPVIRPVLDLTEIQNGQARIGSILGTDSYAFNPNMSYGMIHANNVVTAAGNMSPRNGLMDDTLMAMHREMNQITTDNRTIVSVLGRYLPYIPEISHMQVTLDKKTLVGELTPAIDDALGVRSKRFRG